MIHERAHAKVNLALQVGPPGAGGMHPICSLFVALELTDDVYVEPAARDELVCREVPGDNLALRALAAYRAEARRGPGPLRVRIDKRIPVAAGLGGGSADAAAVLRAANSLADEPLDANALRAVAATLGSDVPSQVEPGHAVVTGTGERVEPVGLPPLWLVLVPSHAGLATAAVYAELDRLGAWRPTLDADALRAVASGTLADLAAGVDNDLQRAALSLRPELSAPLDALRGAGAMAAAISGSGPTAFGLFPSAPAAAAAAAQIDGALAVRTLEASP